MARKKNSTSDEMGIFEPIVELFYGSVGLFIITVMVAWIWDPIPSVIIGFVLLLGVIANAFDKYEEYKASKITAFDKYEASKLDIIYDGYVYIQATVGQSPTVYKIGHTYDLERREKQLAIQLPYDIARILVIKCVDRRKAEAYLHEKYKHRRLNGEWFALTDAEVEYLKTIEVLR